MPNSKTDMMPPELIYTEIFNAVALSVLAENLYTHTHCFWDKCVSTKHKKATKCHNNMKNKRSLVLCTEQPTS